MSKRPTLYDGPWFLPCLGWGRLPPIEPGCAIGLTEHDDEPFVIPISICDWLPAGAIEHSTGKYLDKKRLGT